MRARNTSHPNGEGLRRRKGMTHFRSEPMAGEVKGQAGANVEGRTCPHMHQSASQ